MLHGLSRSDQLSSLEVFREQTHGPNCGEDEFHLLRDSIDGSLTVSSDLHRKDTGVDDTEIRGAIHLERLVDNTCQR